MRHQVVSVLLGISLFMSFFLVWDALVSYQHSLIHEETSLERIYQENAFEVIVDNPMPLEETSVFDTLSQMEHGNVIMDMEYIRTGNSAGYERIWVVVKQNETFPEPLKWGRYANEQDIRNQQGVAVVSKDKMSLATKRDGIYYIWINGYEYEVIGQLANGITERIYLFAETMPKEHKLSLQKRFSGYDSISVYVLSRDDSQEQEMTMLQEFELYASSCIDAIWNTGRLASSEGELIELIDLVSEYRKYLIPLLFVFCIMNTAVVMLLWINEKRREIAVKRAFGWNLQQLVGEQAKRIGGIFLFACGGSGVTVGMIRRYMLPSMQYMEYLFWNALFLICGAAVIGVIVLGVIWWQTATLKPTQFLKERA